ncbi:DUF507 family protein [Candidatus Aminicenantes bacterium AC-708-M15]|jgi:hypothetical protein|nr:DUF507 family protein [SCandidatus Aminicenantes bacterium Aminicenantia_JdfR_composite]MCP2597290.1 DUF507 family protein [Candidatus Aminicenantes bacterium AC-335-G13]MCP2604450.1 DUF507 family protein [Candidatus Aminicenantes bacterium AC-708-M15]MCP2605765.1 DUF507 family protein [Candidatus Aminicenantes bacterium AC-335-O07]MCP2618786.1 DUF507 family protein [Candidatus Aminicenantes bacterium AC-335-A11]MCP2620584.1 DUF507 family protein [Candidatus Aminicenantes bacterium AC-334-E
MRRLSREKINHFSQLILKALLEDKTVDLLDEPNAVRLTIVKAIENELQLYDELDKKAIQKIKSQKRSIEEGSREWEILYRKYYNEELQKLQKIWE